MQRSCTSLETAGLAEGAGIKRYAWQRLQIQRPFPYVCRLLGTNGSSLINAYRKLEY